MIQSIFNYNQALACLSYTYQGTTYKIQIEDVSHATMLQQNKIILLIAEINGKDQLMGYSLTGTFLFTQAAPKHYSFWYLSSSDLKVACIGIDEEAEASGRSGWWFKINPITGKMKKDVWVY